MATLQLVSLDTLALLLLLCLGLAAGGLVVQQRRRRELRDEQAFDEARARAARLPVTLHPEIDARKCIGCLSCMTSCPEGDIIGLVAGRATLLDPSACIGHGRCALECPVKAIRLVLGSSERGVDLPHLTEAFESSRPGVHAVGELGGMGLIKNAITQGLQVAEALAERLGASSRGEVVDVVVVGAGPAGLATAIGLLDAGLTCRVLEQEPSFGGTIAHYPRQKVVMTEQVSLPGYGRFGRPEISKEDLLVLWQDAIDRTGVRVECATRVHSIDGEDGDFTVETSRGAVQARKVVLACGRRGTPRRLGVKGEGLAKVAYRLVDPEQYAGKRVLVVGGGDSALEAALQLSAQTSAKVTLSYRGAAPSRCRDKNRRALQAAVAGKRLTVASGSQVEEIRQREVLMKAGGKRVRLPNDFVLICAGGELPTEFLAKAGVGLRRLWGSEPGVTGELFLAVPAEGARRRAPPRRRLFWALTAAAVATLAVLAAVGRGYYLLDKAPRLDHPLHEFLRPSGAWGHGIGIVASLLMLSSLAYSVRKRVRALKGTAPIATWLTWHQFAGLLSALMIFFHAAFQSRNALASLTAATLGLLVVTGVAGRFVFGLLPIQGVELGDVMRRWERLRARILPFTQDVTDALALGLFISRASAPPAQGGLFAMAWQLPALRLRDEQDLRRLRPLFSAPDQFVSFRDAYWRMWRLRVQAGFFDALKRLFGVWRLLHVVLAVVLLVLIGAHVVVSLFLGHHWVFS